MDHPDARRDLDRSRPESDEKFKYVFDHAIIGVSITLPSGQMQVNEAFCQMLGYSCAEFSRRSWQEVTHPDDVEPQQEIVDSILSGEKTSARFLKRYVRKDGSIVWADVSISLCRDTGGKPLYFITAACDITGRRLAEEEIRRLNENLEQRVRDRTAQLEAANRELEAFAYSVSHDLRAPLRTIDGYARMLRTDYAASLDSEGHRMLGVICSEATRMGQLIDDLLAFSRMSRQAMQWTEVELAALAQAVFDQYAAQVPDRKIRFRLHPLPAAHGDPAMLRQAMVNLLANAVKYTRFRETTEIEVGGRVEGSEYLYYVKDNGVGFDMRYVHKLFGIFQRLHSEAEFEGTGVGLALVQRIIHRHGGRVWAEAQLNEGATFYFTLPIRKGET